MTALPGAPVPVAPALVPEVLLHQADDVYALWTRVGELPYWAFPWPGGQALARYLLDAPALVRSRRVLDVGTGSGLVAVAAALAGAAGVRAVDVDPLAVAAVRINAAANGVDVDAEVADPLDGDGGADVVLVGDLLYDAATAIRVVGFAERCAARGADVLVGDPGRTYLPRGRWEPVATYAVPDPAGLEDAPVKSAVVWRVPQPRS